MLFNSCHFLLFFPLVAVIYHIMATPLAERYGVQRWRWGWLLMASIYFYMAFRPIYILIMALLIVIDYIAGICIAAATTPWRRRALLVMSLAANLGLLGFFKYYGFLHGNLTTLFGLVGAGNPLPLLDMILPVGLSFHTFQSMAYTIEVFLGRWTPERHLGRYALYVLFFPQLVAGPIERPAHLLPQIAAPRGLTADDVFAGLRLMLWGYFKKLVIADRLAVIVDIVFNNPNAGDGVISLIACVFFTFQIYCDFSGYTDIARGSARVLGYELSLNFKFPLFSANLAQFWRRWHISLYSWFNDYVYTPLAITLRSRGRAGIVTALLLTFSLSGLWHGADWNFVIFGLLHGLGLSWLYLIRVCKPGWKLPPITGCLVTFAWVTFANVFFRAASISNAVTMLGNVFAPKGLPPLGARFADLQLGLFWIAVLLMIEGCMVNPGRLTAMWGKSRFLRLSACNLLCVAILLFSVYDSGRQFIYFQF